MPLKKPKTGRKTELWGVAFRRERLSESALTHPSYRNEHPRTDLEDFDRLEFFGDSILNYVICKNIYKLFPRAEEGELSRLRSVLVSKKMLATIARNLDLEARLRVGKSLASRPENLRDTILADSLEAFIAAVFLDSGLKKTEAWIIENFRPYLDPAKLQALAPNPKSALQELCQKHWRKLPRYRSTAADGGVTTEITITPRFKASATAPTKRLSEIQAAQSLVEKIRQGLSVLSRKNSSGKK